MKKSVVFFAIATLVLGACKKDNPGDVTIVPESSNPVVNFSFNQHKTWSGTVQVNGFDGPLAHMPLQLLNDSTVLETGFTDENGRWNLTVNHTPSMNLSIKSEIPTLKGSYPLTGDGFQIAIAPEANILVPADTASARKTDQASVDYRGQTRWFDDRQYVLSYSRGWQYLPLFDTPDQLSNNFLTYIANSVPEEYPVAQYNPNLLASGTTSLRLDTAADVWMTFVDEGAGYRNVVGYFTWTDGNEPTTVTEIDTIWTAFENFSKLNSGGGLMAGDKIYIGSYPAGTNIGFAIIANGYNGNQRDYRSGGGTYFSLPDLNPEGTAEKRQHNVVLYDSETDRVVIGFEDLRRDQNSDEDFNDALFFITSNPPEAIDTTQITPIVTQILDADFDGVPDVADVAPNDARYATTYTTQGRLMFEDLYPFQGDYDFNDVVVDYTAVAWRHANGTTNKMEYTFEQTADGGIFENGIAFAIDGLDADMVSNVVFGNSESYYEGDNNQAVFILSDNSEWPGLEYVNTYAHHATVTNYLTYTVSFEIDGAGVSDVFWGENLDAFIFQLNNNLRNEIHLKYKRPTAKADSSKIGNGDDITLLEEIQFTGDMWNTANNAVLYWASSEQGNSFTLEPSEVTYADTNGFPWAIHVDINVKHPYETVDIREAYTGFSSWVQSLGQLFQNWFDTPTPNAVKE